MPGAEVLCTAYLVAHIVLCTMLKRRMGKAINPLLGITATLMLCVALLWMFIAINSTH
jgi:uncharacterized membrane protein YjgN (DUF898 family)